jgi:type VI secretion system secreted protein VgrG
MPNYSQDGQPLAIETPLGTDKLLLEAFTGEEALGELFVFRLECLSVAETLSDTAIVGKQVSFRVNDSAGNPRWFTGYVSRFSWMGRDDVLTRWQVEVVPSLWFAMLTSDCKIFQQKSVPDIVQAVLADTSAITLSKKISGSHSPWEYCVQYRETDGAFVSRLMEHEGIGYHFEHAQKSLKMVISDSNSAFTDCKEAEVETAQGFSSPDSAGVITSWRHEYAFRPGKFVQTDYAYETPTTDLLATGNGKSPYSGASKAELFDYPGLYEKKPDGDTTAKVRIEAEEVTANVASGKSTCRTFSPGYTFKVKSHPNSAERGKKYLLTKVVHRASIRGAYEASADVSVAFEYENSFEAVPSETVWRPARTTPWPAGTVQTALVVGPSSEEIYTDEYGRIKVQFHWDRYGKQNEQSSCWIRVSQSLAGPQFGTQFLPRVGMEVVVSHLDDDPNRPLVTGVVYNGTNKPPFDLPSKAAQSGVQTRSTKDGSTSLANQLIFDDTKGAEMVTLHAERDFTRTVENDDTLEVGFVTKKNGDRSVKVYNNLTEEIGASGCNAGNRSLTVYKDNTTTVSTGNESCTVSKGNATFEVSQGNHTVTVGGKQAVTAKQGHSLTVSSGSHAVEVNSGSGTMKAMSWTIEGQTGITLKVGSNSIGITPSGVTINGMTVSVKGTTSTTVEGLTTTVKGSATLTAQGAITMIG